MKKIILLAAIIGSTTITYSQDLDDIREALGKKEIDYTKAKDLVDKHLANPKNAAKADAWYYKGYIYNSISKKDELKALCTNCKWEAFEAFKKYQEMDNKNVLMTLEQNASLFDLYNGFFDAGAKAFNDKDYKNAFTNFKSALLVEDYVRGKNYDYQGYKFPALDTSLVLNTALAARLDKNDADAVTYYKILTDANVSGKQYLEPYEYLAEYYNNKKDSVNFAAALAKGRAVFPDEAYWTAIEMESVEKNGTKEDMFVKYDELLQKTPNYTLAYNYGAELFNFIYANDANANNPKNSEYKINLENALKKAIELKSTAEANLLLARYYYNNAYDISDDAKKIKGAKPEDIKKRKALNDASMANMDNCIIYSEAANKIYAAMPALKPVDKAQYKNSLSMLQNIYQIKKNDAKAAEYGKIITSLN
ncbi:MAG: hypothetical protein V4556_07810 [Bacteroidota bacterium]